jgi:hypothetical protein
MDGAHFLSAGVVSFARGLNDTPKIAAMLLAVPALDIRLGSIAVAAAMAIGGLLNARKVAETMSMKNHIDGSQTGIRSESCHRSSGNSGKQVWVAGFYHSRFGRLAGRDRIDDVKIEQAGRTRRSAFVGVDAALRRDRGRTGILAGLGCMRAVA